MTSGQDDNSGGDRTTVNPYESFMDLTLPVERHRLYEDVLAMLLATMLVAIGITLYTQTLLLTGGTTGLSLLFQYVTHYSFGPIFFLINLPFYYLAIKRMGWGLTLRTFAAVFMVSVLSKFIPLWVSFSHLDPVFAAVAGGGLIGIGLLILFRHRATLGGVNILALYLQDNHGIRAGYFQLAVDILILLCGFFVLDLRSLLLSLLGAAVINLIIGMNHKPGRYLGVS